MLDDDYLEINLERFAIGTIADVSEMH